MLVIVLLPWVAQGLALLQRSRIQATLGAEIPTPHRASARASWLAGAWLDPATWRQLGYHLLAVLTGAGFAVLAILFPVAPALARWTTRTDEWLARKLLGPGSREELALRVESLARGRAPPDRAGPARRRPAAAGLAGHEPRHGPGALRRRSGTRPPGHRRRA
jgi:hypothetical protein